MTSSFVNPSNHGRGPNDPSPFELTQYTPEGIQRLSAPYKKDPRLLEKVSKRITARVEDDSSDLITFCDKRLRKRRKKKKLEEEQRRKQHLRPLANDYPVAPEVVMASDLVLGACLGQGSFSSVFVLEKHVQKASTAGVRRGRRSRLARPGLDGTNQGSSHNRSWSNHSSMFPANDNNNSISKRMSRTRSQTPSLRDRLRGTNPNDSSNRSGTGNSQRSRSLSPPRTTNFSPNELSTKSSHERSETAETEMSSPVKVLRASKRASNSERSRSRSLSASISNGIRAVFRRNSGTITNSVSNSNHKSLDCDNEDFEVPLSCAKTFTQKSKSHHVRSQCEDDDSKSGRGLLGGTRSLSLHKRRRSRRSRSRGDKSERRTRGFSLGDYEDSVSVRTGPQFNADSSNSNESNLVVKILQPKLMNQPKLFANCAAGLIREGLFLAAIDHPNVLKVHAWTSPNGWMDFADLARKDGDLYDGYILVLERLQGGSLKGWLRKWQRDHEEEQKALAAERKLSLTASSQESLSHSQSDTYPSYFSGSDRSFPYTHTWPTTQLADRTSLLLQLSDTVRYLHKHRILHRDLKPDNLGVTFIDPRSDYLKQKQYPSSLSLKVFDFDVARLVPEEPKEEPSKKSKRRGSSGAGSVASFDAAIFNSNRSGRSVSPHRTSSSLSGEDPANRKRTKKYRGKRPDSVKNITEVTVPTSIYATLGEVEEPSSGDALFDLTAKMGSPRYMAPEIARGEPYNLRSEVYTVCLLVHEVLTLQKPYDELAPEDHGKLVHFDLPGYRPPVFSEWSWPAELEEVLHLGWGEIHFRPSMKDLHSVLKKTLPKLCPALLQLRSARTLQNAEDSARNISSKSSSRQNSTTESEHKHKARSLFHRSQKKGDSKRGVRSSSLTPTATNSDFSLSNDEPRLGVKAQ